MQTLRQTREAGALAPRRVAALARQIATKVAAVRGYDTFEVSPDTVLVIGDEVVLDKNARENPLALVKGPQLDRARSYVAAAWHKELFDERATVWCVAALILYLADGRDPLLGCTAENMEEVVDRPDFAVRPSESRFEKLTRACQYAMRTANFTVEIL